jgi:hypothetical protein
MHMMNPGKTILKTFFMILPHVLMNSGSTKAESLFRSEMAWGRVRFYDLQYIQDLSFLKVLIKQLSFGDRLYLDKHGLR